MTNSKSAITPMVPHNSTSLKEFCPEEDSQEAADMAQIPYAQLLGLLNYLSVTTRPDIAVATRQLAQVMHKPGKRHWKMAKRVLAYLGGSRAYGLRFRGAPSLASTATLTRAMPRTETTVAPLLAS